MKSIQRRLNIGLALSLVLVFAVLGVGVSLSIRYLTEEYISTRLEHDAESLLVALFRGPRHGPGAEPCADCPDDGAILRSGRINPVYHQAFSGHYYRIELDGEVLRSRSLWDQDLAVPMLAPGELQMRYLQGPQQQLLLARVAGFSKHGRDVTITVAEDLTPIQDDVRSFQLRYLVFSLGMLALLLLVQRYLLRAELRPLDTALQQLQALERGERRLLDEDVPREIHPLVAQVNQLLGVLQQRLQRSRNALGNLAHALKTPLSLVAQVAERPELNDCVEVRRDLRDHVQTLRRLMDRELKRARLAGMAAPGEKVDLQAALDSLKGVLQAMYRDKALDWEVRVDARVGFQGDREDLLELLGNLLDNACKWAAGRVRVGVTGAESLIIRVEDDGPGVEASALAPLANRGVRVDEDAVPGYGLGLAIARDVVSHYQGELRFGRSADLGGFLVEVSFPAQGISGRRLAP